MDSFWATLLLFTAYSMIGWTAETLLCSVAAGKFVNRGFLSGPFCPIYGFGALLISAALGPVQDNLPVLFLSAVVLTSALEYLTGFALETLFHAKYWDYSTRRCNLQGRVCLGNALAFGLGGVLTLRVLQPALLLLIGLIPPLLQAVAGCVLLAYFLLDTVFTVNTLVRLNGRLAELQQVLDEISEKARAAAERTMQPIAPIADSLTGRAKAVADETFGALAEKKEAFAPIADELTERARSVAADTIGALAEKKDALAERRDALQNSIAEKLDDSSLPGLLALYENRERLESGFRMAQRRIIRAFPTMRSLRSNDSLLRMRRRVAAAKPRRSLWRKK